MSGIRLIKICLKIYHTFLVCTKLKVKRARHHLISCVVCCCIILNLTHAPFVSQTAPIPGLLQHRLKNQNNPSQEFLEVAPLVVHFVFFLFCMYQNPPYTKFVCLRPSPVPEIYHINLIHRTGHSSQHSRVMTTCYSLSIALLHIGNAYWLFC